MIKFFSKIFSKPRKIKAFGLSFGAIVAAIFVLNLLFVNAGFPVDLPPQGSSFIGKGYNSEVYKLDGFVYKLIHNNGTETRDFLFQMHNSLAAQMPAGLIPPYEKIGSSTLRQAYADGYDFEHLNYSAKESAARNIQIIVDRYVGDASGKAWTESGASQPVERVYLLPNGSYGQIDISHPGNFKFDASGKVLSWYDPVLVGDSFELTLTELKGGVPLTMPPATQLPIDNGEKLKIVPDPTATGANGLKSVQTFTFLNSVMAVAGVALIANDYRNQYNAATNDDQRRAAHSTFLKSVGVVVGFTIATGAAVIGITALSPFFGAVTAVSFLAVGSFGLGSHISATFNSDALDLWDRVSNKLLIKPDANHPSSQTLRDFQNQQLQLQLKRSANLEGRATVEFRDIARVAVLQDSSFKQVFYAMPNSAGKDFRPGTFLSDVRSKELDMFRRLVAIHQDIGSKKNSTQEEARRWFAEINKISVAELKAMQINTGIGINYYPTFASAVVTNFYEATPQLLNQPSQYILNYLGSTGLDHTADITMPPFLRTSFKPTTEGPATGTLVAPVRGISPSYYLNPILDKYGSADIAKLFNEPGMLLKVGTRPSPLPSKTSSITIRPASDVAGVDCFDLPREIRFIGNGISIERNSDNTMDILNIAAEIQPSAGGSPYSSFSLKEVNNGSYEVNKGLQSCSVAWVLGCGVSQALPWSPFGLSGSAQDGYCAADKYAAGCPCFSNPYSINCLP